MIKYTIKHTTQFKKDYKLAKKRHLDIDLLKDIITMLANGETLPEKYKDHALSAIGLDIVNATLIRIGYLSIVMRMMCLY